MPSPASDMKKLLSNDPLDPAEEAKLLNRLIALNPDGLPQLVKLLGNQRRTLRDERDAMVDDLARLLTFATVSGSTTAEEQRLHRNELERGFTFRPLAVTAKETLDYHFARPQEEQDELNAGVTPEREAEVLTAWHTANG